MEHVGIVVDELPAAIEFFTKLGEAAAKPKAAGWSASSLSMRSSGIRDAANPEGNGEIEPAAPSSSASWCGTRTAPAGAVREQLLATTSAVPRGSSSSWQRGRLTV